MYRQATFRDCTGILDLNERTMILQNNDLYYIKFSNKMQK